MYITAQQTLSGKPVPYVYLPCDNDNTHNNQCSNHKDDGSSRDIPHMFPLHLVLAMAECYKFKTPVQLVPRPPPSLYEICTAHRPEILIPQPNEAEIEGIRKQVARIP